MLAYDRGLERLLWTATTVPGEGLWSRILVAVPDLNDDGYRELAVGSPYPSKVSENAGHLDLISGLDGKRLFRARGAQPESFFGSAVCALPASERGDRFALAVGALDRTVDDPLMSRVFRVGVPSGEMEIAAVGRRHNDGFGRSLAGSEAGAGPGLALFASAMEGPAGSPSRGGCVEGLAPGTGVASIRLIGLQAQGRLGEFLSLEDASPHPAGRLLLAGAPGSADTPSYWGMESYSYLAVLFRESDAWRVRVFASDGEVSKEELGSYVRIETP